MRSHIRCSHPQNIVWVSMRKVRDGDIPAEHLHDDGFVSGVCVGTGVAGFADLGSGFSVGASFFAGSVPFVLSSFFSSCLPLSVLKNPAPLKWMAGGAINFSVLALPHAGQGGRILLPKGRAASKRREHFWQWKS